MHYVMIMWLTLEHGEEKDEHFFLQTQQFSEQLDLAGVFVEFPLEDGKDVEKSGHSIPETTAGESLLVQDTRTLRQRERRKEGTIIVDF